MNVPSGFAFVTFVPFTTVLWDSHGMFSLADPTRLTAAEDGIYIIEGTANYNAGAAGMYGAALDVSPLGVDFPGETQFYSDGTYFVSIQAVGHAALLAGESVELTVEQNTGAAQPLLNDGCHLSMTKVAPYA